MPRPPAGNPLIRPAALPYGAPDFARIAPEHFPPAFAWAMGKARARLDAAGGVVRKALEP